MTKTSYQNVCLILESSFFLELEKGKKEQDMSLILDEGGNTPYHKFDVVIGHFLQANSKACNHNLAIL